VVLFVAGVWAATTVAHHLGKTDPGVVVVDEVVGMLVTLALLPVGITGALVGFFLFRVFDVVKPFPAAQSESLPGGYGIMVDDVVAGLYAHLVLRALAWAWPAGLLVS
jgi:phosphatidylglycerophosphatase A